MAIFRQRAAARARCLIDMLVVSATNQLKLFAPDGKYRLTDVISQECVSELAKHIANNKAAAFLDFMKGIDYSYYYEQND